jgi:hypothetical protein
MIGEFKNELDKEQYIWLAVSYEIYDGPRPDFRNSHVIWLNVNSGLNCKAEPNPFGTSNLTRTGVPKSLVFAESSNPWTSPIDATLLGVGGHLHDGGVSIDFYKNGERICEAKPVYASGAAAAAAAMGSHHADGEHITSVYYSLFGQHWLLTIIQWYEQLPLDVPDQAERSLLVNCQL